MAAEIVNGTSLSGIALLPTDGSRQSKLLNIRFQGRGSLLRLGNDISIALPASARAAFAFRFSLITLHTADPGGVRLQVRSHLLSLVVFVLASNAASLDFWFAEATVSYWQT